MMGLHGNEGRLTGLEVVLLTKADVFLRGGQFDSQSSHPTEMNCVLSDIPQALRVLAASGYTMSVSFPVPFSFLVVNHFHSSQHFECIDWIVN